MLLLVVDQHLRGSGIGASSGKPQLSFAQGSLDLIDLGHLDRVAGGELEVSGENNPCPSQEIDFLRGPKISTATSLLATRRRPLGFEKMGAL